MTVKFTGDLGAARAAVEQYYSGPVCLVEAVHSYARLLEIEDQIMARFGDIGMVSEVVDANGEWVDVQTTAPRPDLQAQFDEMFGPGVVRMHSLMLPVE